MITITTILVIAAVAEAILLVYALYLVYDGYIDRTIRYPGTRKMDVYYKVKEKIENKVRTKEEKELEEIIGDVLLRHTFDPSLYESYMDYNSTFSIDMLSNEIAERLIKRKEK